MQMHASCVAREDQGILLLGPSGSGKSDLALRLIDRGFVLVADDRVDIAAGIAGAPAGLAGLLEIRGLGLMRVAHRPTATLRICAQLGAAPDRLPSPARHDALGLPLLQVDATRPNAALLVEWALDCALGRRHMSIGAFAP